MGERLNIVRGFNGICFAKISQNEKRAKKKGAVHSLIFHFAYKGWPLCGGRCVYAAESPRAVSCAAFLVFWVDDICLEY